MHSKMYFCKDKKDNDSVCGTVFTTLEKIATKFKLMNEV